MSGTFRYGIYEAVGFCREGLGGENRMIRDGLFSEDTGRIEDQFIMSWSTLEYLNANWSKRRKSLTLRS